MFTIGIKNEVKDGFLLEVVSSIYAMSNPQAYNQLILAGGLIAAATHNEIVYPGVTFTRGSIAVLSDLLEAIPEQELKALMAHEMYHLTSGDCQRVLESGVEGIYIDLDLEIAADIAGAKATSAAVMLSALKLVAEFQIRTVTKINNPKVVKFLAAVFRPKIIRKRIKALKAMI